MSIESQEAEKEIYQKIIALYKKELIIFFKAHELSDEEALNAMVNILTNIAFYMYYMVTETFDSKKADHSILTRSILKRLKKRFEKENERKRLLNKH